MPHFSTEKTGYLDSDFRLFHIRDQLDKEFQYHYHDFYKVILLISGNVNYHIEGKAYHLNPRDILLVDRFAVHKPEIDAGEPYERFILWIRGDIVETGLVQCFHKASDRSFGLVRLEEETQQKLLGILKELFEAQKSVEYGADLLSRSLFCQFMVYLNRLFLGKQYILDETSFSYDAKVEELLRYINQNLSGDLSVDTLADKCYTSRYSLMKKFKAETGYTIHSYIQNKRLAAARVLILRGTPAAEAALRCGFQDYTTFFRAYKKQFRISPGTKHA